MNIYQVKDWDALFENDRSRRVEQCRFVCVPNNQHGMGFCRIMAEPDGAAIPTQIQLTCPFGYLDDAGTQHMWGANQIVTDAGEIADLLAHGAEHVDLS